MIDWPTISTPRRLGLHRGMGGTTVKWVFPKKNTGITPKWMVKIMENPIKMDDLGPTPIFGNTPMGEALFAAVFSRGVVVMQHVAFSQACSRWWHLSPLTQIQCKIMENLELSFGSLSYRFFMTWPILFPIASSCQGYPKTRFVVRR